jgi:hypothetical protein
MVEVTFRNARLHNQHITHNPYNVPETVISHMGAIQAQDYQGAKWSIGLRLKDATEDAIENALINKLIVRTWLMRGTLFFVNSNDLRWMQQLLSPKIIAGLKRRNTELELDAATLGHCNKILEKALTDTPFLSRKELILIVEKNGITTEGQRAAHILQYAALHGLICQTNSVKNVPNYISTEQIKAKPLTFTREEALAELAKRYFTSRGPASLQDFIWWSGLTVSDAKMGFESIKTTFISETIDGQIYWFNPGTPVAAFTNPLMHFMPGFDEFLLGYKNRTISLNPQFNNHWCPGNNGMFMPFILKDGQVIGTWKRATKKDIIQFEPGYFKKQYKIPMREIIPAMNKYAKFVNKIIGQ